MTKGFAIEFAGISRSRLFRTAAVVAGASMVLFPPSAEPAVDPVDQLSGSLTLGTKKKPGPVVAFSTRAKLNGTVKVTDRRRGVRFAGKITAKSVRVRGSKGVVGAAVMKIGRQRYTLTFTLTDAGGRRDKVQGRITGPKGRNAKRAGRNYRFSGTARLGNVTVKRRRTGVVKPPVVTTPPTTNPITTNPVTTPTNPVIPPQPFAPALDQTVATTVFDASSFLYSGDDPPQTGVAAGTIRPEHAAVLRGDVRTAGGGALGGVTVTVLDHPEYGQTVTLDDGTYALAVNGGDGLVLDFTKAGFVALQRPVDPGWQRWVALETAVMTPLQTSATAVGFSADGDTGDTVARGDAESDGDGTRRGTLVVPDDTTAEMTLANGSTQPLSGGGVRITEVTVGGDGPAAMPAPLPPGSAYTYAVDLSVDQATAAGATKTEFSHPLPYYVDNFLGFPVGAAVPLGSYDEERHTWVGEESGKVIKIVSETAGLADVDTDGNGSADNTGIDDAERTTLASLYDPPKELWRVELAHFSIFDLNWGTRPPPDAKPPKNLPSPRGAGGADWGSKPRTDGFGTIDLEGQVLHEDLSLTGVDFGLHHSTRRSLGFAESRTAQVRLDDPMPGDVRAVEIQVSVAGQLLRKTLYKAGTAPAGQEEFSPGQLVRVVWDGKDAFGRTLVGAQAATIRVGHDYAASYAGTNRFDAPPGTTFSGSRGGITLWTTRYDQLGGLSPAASGLGGWSPTILHSYDPANQTLWQGDGEVRSASSAAPVIETLSSGAGTVGYPYSVDFDSAGGILWLDPGTGQIKRRAPDGTIAPLTQGGTPWLRGGNETGEDLPVEQVYGSVDSIDRARDGSWVYMDAGCRVRKIYNDGSIWRVRTIAGRLPSDCSGGSQGDGGPAVGARIAGGTAVAAMPDGGAVFSDDTLAPPPIRRIYPDGHIDTLAQIDQPGFYPAYANKPHALAVDRDGRVLWRNGCNVGRINGDGSQELLAGVGGGAGTDNSQGALGTDTGACDENVYHSDGSGSGAVAEGPDGAVYFGNFHSVRRIAPDGRVTTYAGLGAPTSIDDGDGGPARQAHIYATRALGFDPQGRLVIGTFGGSRIRRVTNPLPSFQGTGSGYTIPSEGGREVYVFDVTGRHLRTRDALTGATIWEFTYNGAGLLTKVEDRDGDDTTIERNGDGMATAIVGPDGDRNTLAHSGGDLSAITNPAGQTTSLEYAAGDLLSAITGPRNNRFQFTYDANGRLTKAEDPDDPDGPEGSITLARATTDTTSTVTETTALGRVTSHELALPNSGALRRRTTAPDGTVTTIERGTDDDETTNGPEGTVATTTFGPDPRFGMLAPVAVRREVDPPGSTPTATSLGARTITGLNPLDPFDFTTLTDTITETNGTPATDDDRTTTQTYTKSTKSLQWRGAASPTRTLTATLNDEGRVMSLQRAGDQPVEITYRADGRLATQTRGSRTTTVSYDSAGRPTQLTDPVGSVAGLGYDAARRLTSFTQPAAVGGQLLLSRDPGGNVTGLTTPRGSEHTFAFRPTDDLRQRTPPSVGPGPASDPTTLTFNADRQLTGVDAPGASDLTLGYAANGRLQTLAADGAGTVTASYDGAGRISSLTDSDATLTFGYDGNLPTSETWSAGVTGSVSRIFDDDHRLLTRAVAGDGAASTISFAYDADSLLTGISGAMDATIGRDAATGRATSIDSGSGTATHEALGYSADFGELASQTATRGATELLDATYARDALGRLTSRSESVGGGAEATTTYTYDPLGRLTNATVAGTPTNYTWDRNGNRTSGGAVYDDQDRLTQTSDETFTYTPDGQLRTRTEGGNTTTYTYDARGALRSVDRPNTSADVDYGIDALGRRIERRVGGVVAQRWLYDRENRIVAELDSGNDLIASYAYLPGDHSPFLMLRDGKTFRLITDPNGSIRLVVDTTDGSIAQRIDYDPFGSPTYSGPQPVGFIPFGFAGGQYDTATGLVRMGARDYDSRTGRFTAKDPAGFAGGEVSLYAYAGGDPINGADPTGLGPRQVGDERNARSAAEDAQAGAQTKPTLDPVLRIRNLRHASGSSDGPLHVQYRGASGPWMDAGENFVLAQGDEIRTGADTVADIEFTIGGRGRIGPNSEGAANERGLDSSHVPSVGDLAKQAVSAFDRNSVTKLKLEMQNGDPFGIVPTRRG